MPRASADEPTLYDDRDVDDLKARLAPYRTRVEAALRGRLPVVDDAAYAASLADYLARSPPKRRDPHIVYDPIRHVISAGGKRIRPILTMIACEAVCGDAERALPTAAGLELLHTFTLVHDDVMDNDMTRRGHPTVHALWGGPVAITAGDGLYALAMEAIADNVEHKAVPAEVALAVTRRAAQVSFEICAGQADDILFERSNGVDLAAYMEMIRLKTGVLLALSVEAGGRIGGAGQADVERLATFGLELGLAFQIKDDLLDLVGHEAELGKPIGSDIRAGKKTYPVLHALLHLDGPGRDRLAEILAVPEPDTSATMVAEALRLLERAGALTAAEEAAASHIEAAKRALASVSVGDHPEPFGLLEAIADYIVRRHA